MIYLFTVGWRRPQLAGACGDITGQGAGHVPRRPPRLRLLRLLPPPSEQRVRRQLRPRGALGGDAERRPEGEQASGHEPGRCRSGLGAGSSRAASGVTRPRFLQTWARARARGPSDEDGRALDAVLLQQLLPVLPCPHRHHPARHLVPGKRGRPRRGARGAPARKGAPAPRRPGFASRSAPSWLLVQPWAG